MLTKLVKLSLQKSNFKSTEQRAVQCSVLVANYLPVLMYGM